MLPELLLQDRRRLQVGGIGLVGLLLRAAEVERIEDLRFVVLRVFRRQLLIGLGAGNLPLALGAFVEVLVIRGHRLEVVAFALRLRAHLAAAFDGGLRARRVLGGSALAAQRVGHQDGGEAPGRDRAAVVFLRHFLEGLFRRRVPEGMQHRDGALQLRLHRRAAGIGELHLAELFLRRAVLVVGQRGRDGERQQGCG